MMESNKHSSNTVACKWLRGATVLVAGVAFLVVLVKQPPCNCGTRPNRLTPAAVETNTVPTGVASDDSALPRLLDLGAHKCIPCKMMEPVLEELKKEYAGVFKTEFIDVWQNANASTQYGIESIPTQIFFDAEGKELFRHVGFFSREDILKKWQELGVSLKEDIQ